MKQFADLFDAIDRTTSTNAKVDALAAYFASAPHDDAAWALFFLTGRRLKRFLPTRQLVEWALDLTGVPEWLLSECYGAVGDFGETVALLVDGIASGSRDGAPEGADVPLAEWMTTRILPLPGLDEAARRVTVQQWWRALPLRECFLLNKILTGEFRVGVSHTLVVRAVSQAVSLDVATVEHRMMGQWEPTAAFFDALVSAQSGTTDVPSAPYPFQLAQPIDRPVAELGDRDEWVVEWKWDGIRSQLIVRERQVFLWSRGEELITERFPEVARAAAALPDGTVLDGEVLPYRDGRPLGFAALQRRIGRQQQVEKVARDVPVVFMAYDLLEDAGADVRGRPLVERRTRLRELLAHADATVFLVSATVEAPTWDALATLRTESPARGVEGFMLKRASSAYGVGRRGDDWWKWKIDPYTVDAVLTYAQPGSGRRANLFTDYTFGVWDGDALVTLAKAYSGLSNDEIAELDRWIRRHTIERFGPVSRVEPVQVFELGFEGMARSTRHKSGVAVRFPRILRWRTDKPASDADTLATIRALLDQSIPD